MNVTHERPRIRQVRPLASEPPRQVPDSPYMLAKECAIYLRFANVRALYKALDHGIDIPVRRRGRTLLFHRGDLDRWLAGESRVALHAEARQRRPEPHLKRPGVAEKTP